MASLVAIDTSVRWSLISLLDVEPGSDQQPTQRAFAITPTRRGEDSWLREAYALFAKEHDSERPDYMAVGCGPGSFTGLRLGFSFARTMAMLLQIPLLTFDSLKAWRRAFSDDDDGILLQRTNRALYYGQYDDEFAANDAAGWQALLKTELAGRTVQIWEETWPRWQDAPTLWPNSYQLVTVADASPQTLPLPSGREIANLPKENWQKCFPNYGHELSFIPGQAPYVS